MILLFYKIYSLLKISRLGGHMINFCALYSGSSGNCALIDYADTSLIVDVGVSGKRVIQALKNIGHEPSKISGVLITHEHIDHIKGVGIISRMLDIPIYANENTWKSIFEYVGQVDKKNIRIFRTGDSFYLGDIFVKSFNIPHDAVEPVGYNFFAGSNKITVATDLGHLSDELYENVL